MVLLELFLFLQALVLGCLKERTNSLHRRLRDKYARDRANGRVSVHGRGCGRENVHRVRVNDRVSVHVSPVEKQCRFRLLLHNLVFQHRNILHLHICMRNQRVFRRSNIHCRNFDIWKK